ncbi:protocatechuate 3,4-dioxygenase [Neisseria iguanae]|uniref:Protocatechuate 3,4-dioxygenase n=1 Tax=Neisseria iguanae TaxID=90242 RepID=A0A2P7U0A5_9NEIS|nr:protocatechuate 3,4-dioxygenase [Neisseria iguanae]PSJ80418.1 protocatechuate 3,4-dioxygenase [Neisseria iguanae]
MTAKTVFPLYAALLLAGCNAATVTPYRWHQSGMSESDVARQQRTCISQAKHDAKQGRQPKSLEQCMDEAGYYRYITGNM